MTSRMSRMRSSRVSDRAWPRRVGGLGCWISKDRMVTGAARHSCRAPGSRPRTPCSCCEISGWTRRAMACDGPSARCATAARGRSSATRRSSRARSSRASTDAFSRSARTSAKPAIGSSNVCSRSSWRMAAGTAMPRAVILRIGRSPRDRRSIRRSASSKDCCSTEASKAAAPDITAARLRGQEYLLERRLFRSKSTGQVINPAWTQISFPTRWHYDILWGLDYLRRAGVEPDQRTTEAIDLIASKKDALGRWPLENPHPGPAHFEMEGSAGEPSRWNTLRALRVMRWATDRRGRL